MDLPDLQDGAEVRLDLDLSILRTPGGAIQLPTPPDFVREVWAAGGIVPYFREYGRFPGVPASASGPQITNLTRHQGDKQNDQLS